MQLIIICIKDDLDEEEIKNDQSLLRAFRTTEISSVLCRGESQIGKWETIGVLSGLGTAVFLAGIAKSNITWAALFLGGGVLGLGGLIAGLILGDIFSSNDAVLDPASGDFIAKLKSFSRYPEAPPYLSGLFNE